MPIAAAELNGLGLYAWSFTGFLVASLVAMVAAGEVADRVGPRRPLFGGVAVFVGGLVLAGVAQSMVPFVLARAIQGIGSGFIIVALYLVIARAFSEDLRPRVFAIMAAGWVLPSVVGPTRGRLPRRARVLALGLPRPRPAGHPGHGAHAGTAARARRSVRRRTARSSRRVRGVRRVAYAVLAAVGVALVQLAGQDLVWTSLAIAGDRHRPADPEPAPAATGWGAPAPSRPADHRGDAWAPGRLVLRRRDIHPAHAGRAQGLAGDVQRALAHQRCARLGGGVVVPEPPAASPAAPPDRPARRRVSSRPASPPWPSCWSAIFRCGWLRSAGSPAAPAWVWR